MKIPTALLLLTASSLLAAEKITFESLLMEMTDRSGIVSRPDPSYTCRQFSSYDRASDDPQNKSTWYANGDNSQYLRTENNEGREEAVMMDAAGPGAVVRIWATWNKPQENIIRVYLDDNPEPAIQGPLSEVIDGGLLAGAPLSQGVSPSTEYNRRGHNLYLPVPYAKRCKITYELPIKGSFYYQINYRAYARGSEVKSFQMSDLKKSSRALLRAQRELLSPASADGERAELPIGLIMAGESVSKRIKGPGEIREIALNINAADMDQALRSTVLKIAFDGHQTVWSPIGDFFGTGHQFHPYRSWYTAVTKDGSMSCRWIMPFKESCVISLRNLGSQDVKLSLADIKFFPRKWREDTMFFHATWRQLNSVETQSNEGADHGAFDVNFIEISGQGVYVGDTLTIFNGASAWWGEGDEKIYVDNESFPSHFGTGTEDYYGYAWCRSAKFEAPFHAQPSGAGNNCPGMSVNSRYRLLDGIPFNSSFKFDMELWHWEKTRVNYAPTTFWYAMPGATCNITPDPDSAALAVPKSVEDINPAIRVKGAVEGEGLKITEKTGGDTELQGGYGDLWSGGRQLWWRNGKPGDKLVIEFPVSKAGAYEISANLTKAIDYGIVRVSINNQLVQSSIDLYNDGVTAEKIRLGAVDLIEGVNLLRVEITGANEKAEKRFMFGLDYLLLNAEASVNGAF